MSYPVIAFIVYLLFINGTSIVLMGQDKFSAATLKKGERRVSEGLLFFLAIIGGSLGVYIAMFLFRHKTQKIYFFLGLPLLLLQQIFILYSFFPFIQSL